jgi:DDE superfamily endonuclease
VATHKKNAARLGAHIVFADESSFLLIPNVVRTWAPQGQTPIHRHRQGRRDKISVISGISVSPSRHRLALYYLLFYDNIGQDEVCVFLRELLRHLRGPVIVLLYNSSTHKGKPIEQVLGRHLRLRIEYFPSYAPQLNPDKASGLWPSRSWQTVAPTMWMNYWKISSVLSKQIRNASDKLRGCIAHSELPFSLR